MSIQTKYPKESVLGVVVDNLTIKAALSEIMTHSANKKPACYIVKPYVEHLEWAHSHPEFKKLLNNAYLSLPDGVSLNWAVFFNKKTKGHWWDLIRTSVTAVFNPLELHVSFSNHAWGTDFTWKLLETAAQHQRKVFIVGSPKKSTIGKTKTYLSSKIGGLKIVGTQDGRDPATGMFSNKLKRALIKKLQKTQPDIILLGIGMPHQEELAAELASRLKHGVFIAEGGTFDYRSFGGQLAKAPRWMQKRGLEWLWRLQKEPGRFKRQLAIPRFMWHIYRQNSK